MSRGTYSGTVMSEHVLVPYDGSPLAGQALERAVTAPDTRVTLCHVISQFGVVDDDEGVASPSDAEPWYERAEAAAQRLLADAVTTAADLTPGCPVETIVEVGPPATELLAYVADHDVDHVILGAHAEAGGSEAGLGSVAERVAREATVPVTIVR
jgi:nucleotide-binding universal stress UspA family protein